MTDSVPAHGMQMQSSFVLGTNSKRIEEMIIWELRGLTWGPVFKITGWTGSVLSTGLQVKGHLCILS